MDAVDKQGLQFKSIRPIMMTHDGVINSTLPDYLNTIYVTYVDNNNLTQLSEDEDDDNEMITLHHKNYFIFMLCSKNIH